MMSFLPWPVETKAATRLLFSTGRVRVTRSGGGFGLSLIGATRRSWKMERTIGESGKEKIQEQISAVKRNVTE